MEDNMIIIANISFPPESANDVGKRFLETAPVPDFMTLKGPYVKGMKEGIQAYELYELDNSKIAQGLDFVTNRCVAYFGIPNYRYNINVYFEAVEALKMIGLG
jgi:hypothetical protein